MKELNYKLMCLCLLGIFLASPLFALDNGENDYRIKKEFSKTIKKKFDITTNGTVEIINRHGQVDIKAWNENEVKVEVTILVDARSEEKADEVFDRIDIDFYTSDDLVKGETTVGSEQKSWMSSWWGGNSGNSSNFTINYEVYMPTSCNLNLNNKYGHSTVEKIVGKANITAKYGDVRLDGVDNHLLLDIGYGNATVESAKDADVIIKYGKLRMEDVRDLNLESKYSKIYIARAGDLESISKYDTYRLGEIRGLNNQGKYDDFQIEYADNITATSRYSDFYIEALEHRGKFNLEYGDLDINALSRNFSKLEVDSKYTGIDIKIEDGAEYEFDVATTHAEIDYPSGADVYHHMDQSSSRELKGLIGGSSGKSLVHVRATYGSVDLK